MKIAAMVLPVSIISVMMYDSRYGVLYVLTLFVI